MQVKDTDALYKVLIVVIMCEVCSLFRKFYLCIQFAVLEKMNLKS